MSTKALASTPISSSKFHSRDLNIRTFVSFTADGNSELRTAMFYFIFMMCVYTSFLFRYICSPYTFRFTDQLNLNNIYAETKIYETDLRLLQ